jgi:excisionase family DNA binding protein
MRSLRGPVAAEASVELRGANDNLIDRDERSVTVAAAAEQLGCDSSTVRELLRKGLLSGHRVGKSDAPKGVRIKLWSIRAYEERHAFHADLQDRMRGAAPLSVRRPKNTADDEANARLKAIGA